MLRFFFKSETIITQSEYGDKWPFTVSEGILQRPKGNEVVLKVGNKTYAINGRAQMNKKYLPLDDIWRDDPEFEGFKIALPGDIIERGLNL